jgi:type 1 fimbria pilin
MVRTNHLQKMAVAASAFLALGSHHLNALSDSGTLTIKGSVTATTCTVNFGGGGAGGTTGNTTLQLPSVTPTELATGSAATPVFLTGTTKFTIVTLTNSGGGTACTTGLSAGKTWDLTFTPSAAGTSAIGTVGFLKGGGTTDALVGIKTVLVNSAADTPTFPSTFTNAGGSTALLAAGTSGIAIQAGWLGFGKANHSVGSFTHALTVGIVYN